MLILSSALFTLVNSTPSAAGTSSNQSSPIGIKTGQFWIIEARGEVWKFGVGKNTKDARVETPRGTFTGGQFVDESGVQIFRYIELGRPTELAGLGGDPMWECAFNPNSGPVYKGQLSYYPDYTDSSNPIRKGTCTVKRAPENTTWKWPVQPMIFEDWILTTPRGIWRGAVTARPPYTELASWTGHAKPEVKGKGQTGSLAIAVSDSAIAIGVTLQDGTTSACRITSNGLKGNQMFGTALYIAYKHATPKSEGKCSVRLNW